MVDTPSCQKCGVPLPVDAPAGLCPTCLVKAGLETQDPAEPQMDAAVPSPGVFGFELLRTDLEITRHKTPIYSFGDYELLEEIARGGMGRVYRARQKTLNREVAVKIILSGQLASKEEIQRFRSEAQAAASLRHPNIVAIHEVGQVDGQHFFSMDLIKGKTLHDEVAAYPMENKRAARLLIKIASAVQYAHDHGILHRDLKPANIILTDCEEPHITDFGVAKRIAQAGQFTATGQVIGTPSYMPPEQAAGEHRRLGKPSDVYSLGATLYHLLTGRPPFMGTTLAATLQQVIENAPVRPRHLTPNIDTDLESVCLKCLEKDPKDRYQSASALCDDLQRFLDGQPVSARGPNLFESVFRTVSYTRVGEAIYAWRDRLLLLGILICVSHLLVFLMRILAQPIWVGWIPHGAGLMVILGILFKVRFLQNRTASLQEQQLTDMFLGNFLACGVVNVVFYFQAGRPWPFDELALYPYWAVANGLSLCAIGRSVDGRCFLWGMLYFGISLAMLWNPRIAPALYGVCWLVSMSWAAKRIDRIASRSD